MTTTRSLICVALAAVCASTAVAQTSPKLVAGNTAPADAIRDAAIEKLTGFLTRHPDSPLRPDALFQLGELLVRRADDQFAAAQRTANESAKDAPERPDYTPAIARYEELVKRFPNFPQRDAAAYTLGTLYFSSQRYADAVTMFEMVTSMPQSHFRPEAYFRLGDAQFEIASKQKGAARKAGFVKAAAAYQSATETAPKGGDIYFLSLYKLGWSYYNQATQVNQPEYQQAVDVFGRLVAEYDALTPEQQARLGLRSEAIEYMAVSLTQVGGAEAANRYFATHQGGSTYKLTLLRRLAASLRDQGDFGKAVEAYKAVQAEAPTDSGALEVQQSIIDIYQNRVLEPDQAQQARLDLVNNFAPGSPWAAANPSAVAEAQKAREDALRQSAQYSLSKAQKDKKGDKTRFADASSLYGRYMTEFSGSDSAQAVDFLYGEALYGGGEYFKAGAEYSRAAYGLKGDPKLAQQAGQNAIVSFDSAVVRNKGDRGAQDSLFTTVDRYVAAFPATDVAKKALIQKGKRASEAERWDVMEQTFRTYAEKYPNDAYTPTAKKLIGDALYKEGQYTEAQGQWELAQSYAAQSGRKSLVDSISKLRNAAAVSYGDSLVKAGDYRQAAEAVYVAYADRNPGSEKAPDALRNAIEVYMLADSTARKSQDFKASQAAQERALELSKRLVTQYPNYKYKVQYQALQAQLLSSLGRRDEAVDALGGLIQENPTWSGRPDAMVRYAVMLDSIGKPKQSAVAYAQFAGAYPKDPRAADAQFNSAVTYLQAGDTADAARAYGTFATKFPKDKRAGEAQASRVALLKAGGNVASANAELARLCTKPTPELKASCDERVGQSEFQQGQALFPHYQRMKLVIASMGNLTRSGIDRLSRPKKEMLTQMSGHFTKSIASGAPEWVAASSYYSGLAQWEYGNFIANVQLPKALTDEQRNGAQAAAAKQADQYYQAANKLWQALVDKAGQDKFDNPWVQRARDALQGKVDANPGEAKAGGGL